MRHLDDGTLRRMADEPLTIADSQRRHYDACPQCQERYRGIGADARHVDRLLMVPSTAANASVALSRVRQKIDATSRARGAGQRLQRVGSLFARLPRPRWDPIRPLSVVVAALAIISAFLWTPAGSLAQDFIGLFQPTQLQQIQTTSAELQSLQGLSKYGTFHAPHLPTAVRLTTSAEAAAKSGMTVLVPQSGLPGVPSTAAVYAVEPSSTASFTFSVAKAEAAAAAGEKIPPMPANIDGSTLQVTIGSTVITEYPGGSQEIPQLAIGQMRAPTVASTGVSVKQLEDYVLNLPEVPSALAQQIRSINDPAATLPIPIPVDLVNSHSVDVQGVKGIGVGDNTGVGSGVLWEKNGIVYVVAGALTDSQVQAIANSLH